MSLKHVLVVNKSNERVKNNLSINRFSKNALDYSLLVKNSIIFYILIILILSCVYIYIFSFLKDIARYTSLFGLFTGLFLTPFLPGHYVAISANVLYFSSSITRVSIPWAGVHSKMPTTVSSSSCSNVCNDGRSTSSSRPTCSTAKSRSRLFGERKRGEMRVQEFRERTSALVLEFFNKFSRFDSYRRIIREIMTIRNFVL